MGFGPERLAGVAVLLAACGSQAAPASPAASSASVGAAAPASSTGSLAAQPAGSSTAASRAAAASKPAASGAASASAAASGAAVAIKSAYTTTSASTAPLWVAKEAGYFQQEGLDVSLSRVQAGAPILAALASEDVPIAFAGGQEIVDAIIKGSNLVIVAGFGDKLTDSIYTEPSITTPRALKGKALGVTNYGAISHIAGKLAVEKMGLKGEVNFVATGGPPATLAAIRTGKVQGGVFSPPQTFKAADEGLHELVDVSTLDVKVATTIVATSRKYITEHAEVVRRYVKAAIEGAHRAVTDEQAGKAAIAKYGGVNDPRVVSKTYDYFQAKWGHDGAPSLEGIKENIAIAADEGMSGANSFKPDQFVDTRFVTSLKKSGFLDQLWSGGSSAAASKAG